MNNATRSWPLLLKSLVIFYVVYCALHIQDSLTRVNFPYLFTWTELFINYSGGFIRRGLLGQILFYIIPYVSLYYLLVSAYIGLIAALTYIFYRYFSKSFDRITTLFVLISPAYFLFHIKDSGVFARKDILVELFVFISCNIVVSCILKKKCKLFLATFLILCMYAAVFLTHEMALFYFPLPFVLLGVAFKRENKLLHWLIVGAVVVIASLAVGYVFKGTVDQRYAICAAWRQYYPKLSCPGVSSYTDALLHYTNAFSYIGMGLSDNLKFVTPYYHDAISLSSAAFGAFLAFLPLALICRGYNSLKNIKDVLASPVLRLFFLVAACAPWILPLIASDFGRHISGACLSYLFFLLSIQRIAPQSCAPWLQKWNTLAETSLRYGLLTIMIALIYGLGWELRYWVAVGVSLVQPDIMMRILFFRMAGLVNHII